MCGSLSCYRFGVQLVVAPMTGTLVNNESTSKETIVSCSLIVRLQTSCTKLSEFRTVLLVNPVRGDKRHDRWADRKSVV